MAVIKMGALVTEIIGSLGGTAFKRQKGTQVMFKKSNGASRSKLLQNPRLLRNSTIFRKWTNLNEAEKYAWNTLASTNKVKDKFGNDVNISGVNFQRKCDLAVNFMNEIPDPFAWEPRISDLAFAETPTLDWTNSFLEIKFLISEGTANVALMLQSSLNVLQEPVFISRGVWDFREWENDVRLDIFDEFFIKFPWLDSRYSLRLYAYCFNSSGVVSSVIQSNILLIEN